MFVHPVFGFGPGQSLFVLLQVCGRRVQGLSIGKLSVVQFGLTVNKKQRDPFGFEKDTGLIVNLPDFFGSEPIVDQAFLQRIEIGRRIGRIQGVSPDSGRQQAKNCKKKVSGGLFHGPCRQEGTNCGYRVDPTEITCYFVSA